MSVSKVRLIKWCAASLLAVFLTAYLVYSYALHQSLRIPADGLQLDIEKGEPLNSVLQRMHAGGYLAYIWPAKIYIKQQALFGNALENKIQAGEFLLSESMNLPSWLHYISSNNQISYSIQFIEGSRFSDALSSLRNEAKLVQALKGMSEKDIAAKLGITDTSSMEGQIYPDTYSFHKGDSDLDILSRAHIKLKQVLDEEWQNRKKDLPLKTPYEALILASIIEKETGVPGERPEIAGVFVRRLLLNMRLQTDPTVIYGIGDRYQGNITAKHLREDTPYNTYKISGLPPTPIALVGRAAIHAAVNPLDGKSLYFVAKGDGSHKFSETLEEHNSAVQEFQLKRRPDYRSTIK